MPDQVNKRAPLFEGGGHKCVIDGFETTDEAEWEAHCMAPDNETGSTHVTEEGAAPCIICGTEVEFGKEDHIPFVPFKEGRKIVQVTCENCSSKIKTGRAVKKI